MAASTFTTKQLADALAKQHHFTKKQGPRVSFPAQF